MFKRKSIEIRLCLFMFTMSYWKILSIQFGVFFIYCRSTILNKSCIKKKSIEKEITIFSLIFGSWFLFLLGLLNNICSFVTFRRSKCLRTGVGYYLLWMCVVNQIDLTLLALRLTHLTLNITNFRSDPQLDTVFCKLLNYLLIAFSRIPY